MSTRPVVLTARQAAAIGVILEIIQDWLKTAPRPVLASLADAACGGHSSEAMTWVSLLLDDIGWHRARLAAAAGSASRAAAQEPS